MKPYRHSSEIIRMLTFSSTTIHTIPYHTMPYHSIKCTMPFSHVLEEAVINVLDACAVLNLLDACAALNLLNACAALNLTPGQFAP